MPVFHMKNDPVLEVLKTDFFCEIAVFKGLYQHCHIFCVSGALFHPNYQSISGHFKGYDL